MSAAWYRFQCKRWVHVTRYDSILVEHELNLMLIIFKEQDSVLFFLWGNMNKAVAVLRICLNSQTTHHTFIPECHSPTTIRQIAWKISALCQSCKLWTETMVWLWVEEHKYTKSEIYFNHFHSCRHLELHLYCQIIEFRCSKHFHGHVCIKSNT